MNLSRSRIRFFNPAGPGFYHARWIVQSGKSVIENAYLELEGGQVRAVSKSRPGGKVMDLGPGVILPALVNAHVHLELSALKGALAFDRGFTAWVRDLLARREALGEDRLRQGADLAAAGLIDTGTGLVGEISTLGITRDLLGRHGLSGVWFREVLGGKTVGETAEAKGDIYFSLAGHAPHTTAPQVLIDLKKQAGSLAFSIHLAESGAESEFMETGRGSWARFLETRGIDISSWPVGNTTPVQYLDRIGVLDAHTLAVHLLQANDRDIEVLARRGTRVCLCPRSNETLHHCLPDLGRMLDKGLAPALGTDSLASCDSLNLLDETAFVRKRYPDIGPETVFDMATVNGAKALGFAGWGRLDPGKRSCFIYADIEAADKNQIFERLTWNDF